jgi:RNA polymerase sigma-70 factor (ECF subfamily)
MGDMDDQPNPAGQGHSTTEYHVQRARAGDRSSFADLFERLAQGLEAWAHLKVRGSLRNFIEPHDIVQETWWRAMDAFDRFDPERSGFRPWMFGIAQNVLLETFRNRRRSAGARASDVASRIASLPPDLARQATSVSRRFMLDESVKALVAEVVLMDEEDRHVIVHMGIEGLTAAESASLTGSTVEATKKRWQRLRERLRNDPRVRDVGKWIN